MNQKPTRELYKLRGVSAVDRQRGAEYLVPEQEEGLYHIAGELFVMHFLQVVCSDERAHYLLID